MNRYRLLHPNRSTEGIFRDDTGYTLLELVIVLSILSALLAISWPQLRSLLRKASHQTAALQLKDHCAEAREEAIRNGETWELYCYPGTSKYAIRPAKEYQPATLQNGDTSAKQEQRRDQRPAVTAGINRPPELTVSRNLPDDLVFTLLPGSSHAEPASSKRPTGNSPQELRLPLQVPNTPPPEEPQVLARFFPDGRVTETAIEVVSPKNGDSIQIKLRGLTGGIKIGPVVKAISTQTSSDTDRLLSSPDAEDN